MSREVMYLGPVPADEDCVQVGDPIYDELAPMECELYIRRIRETLGREPEGSALKVVSNPHDLGDYLEVVYEYDPDSREGLEYAMRLENDPPLTWE